MSKSRKSAAAAAAHVTEAQPVAEAVTTDATVTAPEAVPVTEAPAEGKKKLGRDKLREMGVGLVFEDEAEARASKPTFVPAEGSAYDLYKVSNGVTYWTWSIDSRRAYEHVCRHLGFEAVKADKAVRQSAVTAIKDENAALKAKQAEMEAKIAAYEAKLAAMNGATS
jgi:hypothetical protein